eukprot:1175566-Prorocentrum_minimum.AAC.2
MHKAYVIGRRDEVTRILLSRPTTPLFGLHDAAVVARNRKEELILEGKKETRHRCSMHRTHVRSYTHTSTVTSQVEFARSLCFTTYTARVVRLGETAATSSIFTFERGILFRLLPMCTVLGHRVLGGRPNKGAVERYGIRDK